MSRKLLALAWAMFHIMRSNANLDAALRGILLVLNNEDCKLANKLIQYDNLTRYAESVHIIHEHGNVTIKIINPKV